MARSADQDVAIVGLACRVAGSTSPSELWENLMASRDLQQKISRFNIDGFYSPQQRAGTTQAQHGYFLPQELSVFDADFFSISPQEAAAIDPQQRLLLEVVYEALEAAGLPLTKVCGSNTAVYTGIFTTDYHSSLLRDIDSTPKYQATGTANSIAANRISYFFDLHGPSVSLDTACSSTMVALDTSVKALQRGESSMAIVCGANLILNPDMFVMLSQLGFLSPDGRCKSFDESANGYARGEGVLALVLKPLQKALQDGDPVRAVIKGTRLNQDGRTQGITSPSISGQMQNLRGIFNAFDINPDSINYLEAHGAGTQAGDSAELAAVNAAFALSNRQHKSTAPKLIVGSIKSNIGHLESCAGLAGIIKVVESLNRGIIPPQRNLSQINPKLDTEHIAIPTTALAWPEGNRRASVNSFGFGGTNGHAVLDWGKPYVDRFRASKENLDLQVVPTRRPYLFKVSAQRTSSLKELANRYAEFVSKNAEISLADLSYTMLSRRSTLKYTNFIIADTKEALVKGLSSIEDGQQKQSSQNQGLCYIFTGQGAQWVQMGAKLLQQSPEFRSVLEECDLALRSLPDEPQLSIVAELLNDKVSSRVYDAEIAQPVCTALQIGLASLWRSYGITPATVVGHSSGEIGAAYAAGILSLRDTMAVSYYRGKAISLSKPAAGGMCAVGLSQSQVEEYLQKYVGRIDLAAVNSPRSCTIAGDLDAIEELEKICKEQHIFVRRLRTNVAYHSHHLRPTASIYQSLLEAAKISPSPGVIPLVSSVAGSPIDGTSCTAQYWVKNLLSTVLFSPAVAQAVHFFGSTFSGFLEIGPHPALRGPVEETISTSDYSYFSSLVRGADEFHSVLTTAGVLHLSGMLVDLDAVNGFQSNITNVITDLPPYAWDHTRSFWAETRLSHQFRNRTCSRHELLGSRLPTDTPRTPTWRNMLTVGDVEWLCAMIVSFLDDPYASATVLLLIAIEAGRQLDPESTLCLRNINIAAPLQLTAESKAVEIRTALCQSPEKDSYRLEITTSMDGTQWVQHCTGQLQNISSSSCNFQTPVSKNQPGNNEIVSLLDSFRIRHPTGLKKLSNLQTSVATTSGNFPDSACSYPVDPSILSTILQLPSLAHLSSAYPASHRITTISVLEVSAQAGEESFFSQKTTDGGTSFSANISVRSNTTSLSLRDVRFDAQSFLRQTPPLRSLFYKPELLTDLTLLDPNSLNKKWRFKETLTLITHKFPGADILLVGVTPGIIGLVTSTIGVNPEDGCRRRYRSLRIIDTETLEDQTESEGDNNGLHFLMVSDLSKYSADAGKSVADCGFLCTRSPDVGLEFDTLYSFDIEGDSWHLFRKRREVTMPTGTSLISMNSEDDIHSLLAQDYPPLVPHFLPPHHLPDHSSNIIVFDKPSHTTLQIPLLPILLKAPRLLWISSVDSQEPFHSITSGFLRTLSSEHQIPATHLILEGPCSPSSVAALVRTLLSEESSENEILLQDGIPFIIRYHPDDDRSRELGLLAPQLRPLPVTENADCMLVTGPRQGPEAVLVLKPRGELDPGSGVMVQVHASVINRYPVQDGRFGCFFTGTILRGDNVGECVAGWSCNSGGASLITVKASHIVNLGAQPQSAPQRVAAFASFMMALLLADKARIRRGDKFILHQLPTLLEQALIEVIHANHAEVVSDGANADFSIEWHHHDGLKLNGALVQLTPQASRTHLLEEAGRLSKSATMDVSSEDIFPLNRYEELFQHGRNPLAVLEHDHGTNPVRGLAVYHDREHIFSISGVYVVVGGFGGVGKIILKWMAEKGARHIIVLSRRARKASSNISAGIKIESFSVDACNLTSLQQTFSQIRQKHTIKGILNLATVLNDATLSSMTPQQWEATLESKVRISWNLHQVSQQDNLHFFIMFSSISAIIGNKGQGNYAAGNAFQNGLATYRRSNGLPAVSVAAGMLSGVGVLKDRDATTRRLKQSGLSDLGPDELIKLFEAAICDTALPVIVSGFEMFDRTNDKIEAQHWQTQLFWADRPEFGFMFNHKLSTTSEGRASNTTLKGRLERLGDDVPSREKLLLVAFKKKLGDILGSVPDNIDESQPLSTFGLDSLSALECRNWFYKELDTDVSVFDLLAGRSIAGIVKNVADKLSHGVQDFVDNKPQHHISPSIRPLSQSQKRLWFLQNYLADKTVHNLLLVCKITGTLDVEAFTSAWTALLQRHEVLRSKFVETSDGLQNIPIENAEFVMEVENSNSQSDFEAASKRSIETARNHVFDIYNGEVVRGWMVQLHGKCMEFHLASHHLAWDRKSTPRVFAELSAIYANIQTASHNPFAGLQEMRYQFVDYSLWEQSLPPDTAASQLEYWSSQLQGVPEAVSLLPIAKLQQRPQFKDTIVTENARVKLSESTTSQLRKLCNSQGATPFMVFTCALSALLSQLTGDKDLVVGIADDDRGHPEFNDLVGYVVNMLPIRCKFPDSPGCQFNSSLEMIRAATLGAYEHRAIPLNALLQHLSIPRSTSHNPLFQVSVNYVATGDFPSCDFGSFQLSDYRHFNARTLSDISLEIEDRDKYFLCNFEFDTRLYHHSSMETLAETFVHFLSAIVESQGEIALEQIPLQSPNQIQETLRQLDRKRQDVPAPLPPRLFEESCVRYPNKLALKSADGEYTYKQLRMCVNSMASALLRHEAFHPGCFIAVVLPQGTWAVVGLLAIIQAGGVYVPIDTNYPALRISQMVEAASVRLALVDMAMVDVVEKLKLAGLAGGEILDVRDMGTKATLTGSGPEIVPRDVSAEDGIYCCFTSGSTGIPKGVVVTHGNVAAWHRGVREHLSLIEEDVFLVSGSFTFDMAVFQIFGAILTGATLCVASREEILSPNLLLSFAMDSDVTFATLTPTQWLHLYQHAGSLSDWSSMRIALVGGEPFPPILVDEFFRSKPPNARLINGYGATETTICHTFYECKPSDAALERIPIGKAFDTATQLYVLDSNLRHVPKGFPGELYTGGPYVSKGYLNASSKPFLSESLISSSGATDKMVYRTGDLVRVLDDGNLEHLGRIAEDRQIKLRGVRIDLSDVEATLWNISREVSPKVSQVVVVLNEQNHGVSKGQHLVVYFTIRNTGGDDGQTVSDICRILKKAAAERLPVNMVPSYYECLDTIPLTSASKVDYRMLCSRTLANLPETVVNGTSKKLTDIQTVIAEVWEDVLGAIDCDLTPSTGFFDVGGHSLALVQVQGAIKRLLGVKIGLSNMFGAPSLKGMEALIEHEKAKMNHAEGSPNDADNLDVVDWAAEATLPMDFPRRVYLSEPKLSVNEGSGILIVGAAGMAGSHLLRHLLDTTVAPIYCIAVPAEGDEAARQRVIDELHHWDLLSEKSTTSNLLDRITVYSGALSDPTLGLTAKSIALLDAAVDTIYHADSFVSLLKNYSDLRAANLGATTFLTRFAAGTSPSRVKVLNYISTWGVPHLQTFQDTVFNEPQAAWCFDPRELDNFLPGSSPRLAYLKCRWACEQILLRASKSAGIPVNIIRTSMCSGSTKTGRPLNKSDINRRILAASLLVGGVPDFHSESGGGMSWLSIDYLASAMVALSSGGRRRGVPKIWHIKSQKHILYRDMADVLRPLAGYGKQMEVLEPEEWLRRIAEHGSMDAVVFSETLESMYENGWVPFELGDDREAEVILDAAGLRPPVVDTDMLRRLVVGDGVLEF
ncbi:hypothetical protein K440DRAFT_607820 [Wilcoxina mikolae CBS 423.85]|nr:hypothetical protein K440DRAFT_607820 [Wilcoxina mikolae CBS 423.85]